MTADQEEMRGEYEAADERRCKIMELLGDAGDADERAGLLDDYADTAAVLSRTCDPRRLPPLQPGEGSTWPQVWAQAPAIAALAAGSERRIAVGGAVDTRVFDAAAEGEELEAWLALYDEVNRIRRAGILTRLYSLASQRTGTRAAQILADLAPTEHRIGALAGRRPVP